MSQHAPILDVSRPRDGVLLLTLNRPEARNALNNPLLEAIAEALDAAADDRTIGAAVITGGGRVFAAGADLKEMAALDAVDLLDDLRPRLWQRIDAFPKPLLAAVNGFALGAGCELALHADILLAGRTARFGQPEINLGIMPGAGGTQRLLRRVGRSVASRMVLAAEFLGAGDALRFGLVAEVTEPELTVERSLDLAQTIAGKPSLAVRQAKEALRYADESHLAEGLRFERKAFCVLGASEDRNEGIAAFLEKRTPDFKGK